MPVRKAATLRQSDPAGLTQVIYEGLREEITTGKLKPGELLSRRRIAERYGASYTPVIEAMVRLENAGLVEAEASQMARVRQVSIETIQNTYVLREALETQAIRLACERALDAEIDDLYRLAEEVDERIAARDRGQPPEVTRADDPEGLLLHWRFHRRIAELSRVPALVTELERIELLRRLQANWIYIQQMLTPLRYHCQLVDAIRARDVQAADTAMRAHVRRGFEKEVLGYRMKLPE